MKEEIYLMLVRLVMFLKEENTGNSVMSKSKNKKEYWEKNDFIHMY